jgi:hypothetical protein
VEFLTLPRQRVFCHTSTAALGEPACGGQGGAIGYAVYAEAGDDMLGCVELIQAIFGHRAPPLRSGIGLRSAWRRRELHRFAYRNGPAKSVADPHAVSD